MSMAVCSFCGKDFAHLNKHSWRCEAKLDEINPRRKKVNPQNEPVGEIKCICGKSCKGIRGLKAHQRTCRSVKHLCENVTVEEDFEYDGEEVREPSFLNEVSNVKPGILLPKSQDQWEVANSYFQTHMAMLNIEGNIHEALI